MNLVYHAGIRNDEEVRAQSDSADDGDLAIWLPSRHVKTWEVANHGKTEKHLRKVSKHSKQHTHTHHTM